MSCMQVELPADTKIEYKYVILEEQVMLCQGCNPIQRLSNASDVKIHLQVLPEASPSSVQHPLVKGSKKEADVQLECSDVFKPLSVPSCRICHFRLANPWPGATGIHMRVCSLNYGGCHSHHDLGSVALEHDVGSTHL